MKTINRRCGLWVSLFLMMLAGAGGTALAQSNPVPFVNLPLVPDAAAPGSPDFTLTVNGTGFEPGSVVRWNGAELSTTFVRSSELAATVPAADIASAGTATVTVTNPGAKPVSNAAYFQITEASTSLTFVSSTIPVAAEPAGVIAADFNGDGNVDLAVSNVGGTPAVNIYLGHGDGTFGQPTSYSAGGGSYLLAAGDFNGDGNPDLAVSSSSNDSVAILLGNGDGTFGAARTFPTSSFVTQILAADFNGDGNLDLAGILYDYGIVVLLGNGDGTFQPQILTSAQYADSETIGDFNADGHLDILLSEALSSDVWILLGKGDGTFRPPAGFNAGSEVVAVVAGDFNGDANLDVGVAVPNFGFVDVLPGTGHGTLGQYAAYATAGGSGYIAAADFNGDGRLDLAVTDTTIPGFVSILLNGAATFQPFLAFETGGEPEGFVVADFNGDGRLDVAAANFEDNTLSILLQQTSVAFTPGSLTFPPQTLGTTSATQQVTLSNESSSELDITAISVTGGSDGAYSETNNCGSKLAAGASCAVTVAFTPPLSKVIADSVAVKTASDGDLTFVVIGSGTASRLTPAHLRFGNVPVGTRSSAESATLYDVGPGWIFPINISITGTNSGDFSEVSDCGTSVHVGKHCSIRVEFDPTAAGIRTASLAVETDSGGVYGTQYVTLSGTGTQ